MKWPWESEEDATLRAERKLAGLKEKEEEKKIAAQEKLNKEKTQGAISGLKEGVGNTPNAIRGWWQDWNKRRYDRWRAHPFRRLIMWTIILAVIIWFIWWLGTTTGQESLSSVEEQVPYLREVYNSPIIRSTLGTGLRILTGEYDPSNLWTSEQVQSKYSAAENLEVLIDDVGPTRDFFYSGDTEADYPPDSIQIGGRINVIGGLEENTPIGLTVTPRWLCPSKFAEKYWDWINPFNDDDDELEKETEMRAAGCTYGVWDCEILGEGKGNVFEVKDVYNRQFYCNHVGINNIDNTETISDLDVKWTYVGEAVAGKQIYVFSREAIERYEDPIGIYEISEDTIQSWYIGEDSVNIALGLPLGNEYMRAYNEEVGGFAYPLAISIENTGSGDIVGVNGITITWPNNENIKGSDEVGFVKEALNQFEFVGIYDEVIRGTQTVPLKRYDLKAGGKKSTEWNLNNINRELEDDPVGPGEYITFYINLAVDEDYLEGASYQSFLAKADISYNYTNAEATAVTIKPYPSATDI